MSEYTPPHEDSDICSSYSLSSFLQGCRTAGVSGPVTFIVTSLDAKLFTLASENKLSHERTAVSSVLHSLTEFIMFLKSNELIEPTFIALMFLLKQDNLCAWRGWDGRGALH